MPVSPARAAAFDILLRVDLENAYASELLHSSRHRQLSSSDHGLATELVMGVLRWRSWLDARIAEMSSLSLGKLDPEILVALRLAAYQLRFLERVPQRAAVHESVELVKRARKRSAVPFANAVLRKMTKAAVIYDATASIASARTLPELAAYSAHPLWLIERWERNFGIEITKQICVSDQQIPGTSIRLASVEVADELRAEGIEFSDGELLRSARCVLAGDLTKTNAYREGRIAIQGEASQLVALLLGRGAKILDCCAAPGGKTRVLAQQNPDAEIVAVELHAHRARLLRELVFNQNVRIVNADVRELPAEAGGFDRVLVDVPCSGTGTLGHNPEIKWRLRVEDMADLPAKQLAILLAAMRQVAPGGRLVYSTCSLEPEENMDVVREAMAADSSFHMLDCGIELERLQAEGELSWKDLSSLVHKGHLQTLPGVHPVEGFFAAILEKQ